MTDKITSPDNEKLKLVRKLADARGRAKHAQFATEGEDLLAAGLAAGAEPDTVLAAAGSGIEGIEVEPELLDRVSGLGSGTRVIAIWPLPATPDIVTEAPVCAYLHGISDPGNVGAIIRTAAALGHTNVVLGSGCADPYSPKATRASMGAVFARRPLRGEITDTPAPRLALEAHGGPSLDDALAAATPRTICLGSEREGLDEATLEHCEMRATIATMPSSAAGVDSLNVAATAAIVLQRVCSAAASSEAGGDD